MQDWLHDRSDAAAALAVVFLPMLDSDDRASAANEAERLADSRVACFWDPARVIGTAWTAGYHAPFLATLLEGFAADDPLASRAREWMESGRPVWDVVYVFDGQVSWPDVGLPTPVAWTKQVQFGQDEHGRGAGGFWRSDSPDRLVWSAWAEEFATAMDAVAR